MWRVMIADDEPYIREGLEKLIPWEELGCELIYVAENGQDLLEQIRSCPPDIAIIDIKMPLMDGMEVAEYIYKNHIRTSVIFLTAYADFQYARKAIQYRLPSGRRRQRCRPRPRARGRADRKSTRLNSSHVSESRMPSSA